MKMKVEFKETSSTTAVVIDGYNAGHINRSGVFSAYDTRYRFWDGLNKDQLIAVSKMRGL